MSGFTILRKIPSGLSKRSKFGAPLEHDQITSDTFSQKQVVYQIGIAPVRVDILSEITGVKFPDAWRKRVASTFFGVPVHFISLT
jgi:hypothetical protein